MLTEDFARTFSGDLVRPGDPEYDSARSVWNGMIDRRPRLIARCHSTADVVAAVGFARDEGIPVAVRGGGHNVAGFATCDDGLVIDLSPMSSVVVDPVGRRARVGGGARWGAVDAATQAHGLVAPGGLISETGVAGLTLGGGLSWVRNKYGLSCDNVVGAEVVTAGGQVLWASEVENEDLFWALRGGGGNFGIVTSFEFQLHPLGPTVAVGFVLHEAETPEEATRLLRFFRGFAESAPDELGVVAFLGTIPPHGEAFPEEIHGKRFVALATVYAGDAAEGEPAIRPLREAGTPLVDWSGLMPWVDAQRLFDADYPARELRYYWKGTNLDSLSDQAIDVIVQHARRQPSPLSTTDIWHLGGAIRRVDESAMAFSGRGKAYSVNPEANWRDPGDDAANIAWARDLNAALRPFSDGSRYLNFPGFHEEGETVMQATFGSKLEKLARIKAKYDPTNLFRLNQNIRPAA